MDRSLGWYQSICKRRNWSSDNLNRYVLVPWNYLKIGVSIKGRPKFGVIHKPFMNPEGDIGRTYFGSIETGAFYIDTYEHMPDV